MKSWKLKFTMILDMVYSFLIIQYFNTGISLPFPIQGASARFSIFLIFFPTIIKNLVRYYYQRTPGLNVFLGVSGHLNFKVLWLKRSRTLVSMLALTGWIRPTS